MDGPDLAPATRKRKPEPPAAADDLPPAVTSNDELTAHIHAIESSMRALDARLELLERLVRSGFQEIASRSLVVAEATDEVLTRIDTRVAALDERVDTRVVAALDHSDLRAQVQLVADRLESLFGGPTLTELMDRLDERVGTRVDALDARVAALDHSDVHAEVRLVAERLSALLGGPTLTELMDRLDEIAERPVADETKRRRRKLTAE